MIEPVGRNIYGEGEVRRRVYEVQASIRRGNSGGPFVLPDGRVAGVVFANSVVADDVGYAIVSTEVLPSVQEAEGDASNRSAPARAPTERRLSASTETSNPVDRTPGRSIGPARRRGRAPDERRVSKASSDGPAPETQTGMSPAPDLIEHARGPPGTSASRTS